jgi:hypothetical protein
VWCSFFVFLSGKWERIFGAHKRRGIVIGYRVADGGAGALVAHAASKLGKIVKDSGQISVIPRAVGQDVDIIICYTIDRHLDLRLRPTGPLNLVA